MSFKFGMMLLVLLYITGYCKYTFNDAHALIRTHTHAHAHTHAHSRAHVIGTTNKFSSFYLCEFIFLFFFCRRCRYGFQTWEFIHIGLIRRLTGRAISLINGWTFLVGFKIVVLNFLTFKTLSKDELPHG